tara:strand:- start:1517 stop:4348 length:2832 start_codon:yes stop_codon:yes gene_type:complete
MPTKFDFISPGVLLREIDQSTLPPAVEEEGPIIIGRTRKGPAMKPIKVRSLDDFIATFGRPVPGGATNLGDVWRDGNTVGPTYASYAAQSWLASGNSPVTMVRLLGEELVAGTAGWKTSGSANSVLAQNGGAYGLFLINSGTAGTEMTGTLGAVFYIDSGELKLNGNDMHGHPFEGSAGFVKSSNTNEFRIDIENASGNNVDKIVFNFNRNDEKYIRNVFNTNPMLVNSAMNASPKTYWLGESYERSVSSKVSSTGAGNQYAILLPLESGSANWGHNKQGMKCAYSGWTFSQDFGDAGSYQPEDCQRLFRAIALHEGEEIQKEVVIAIENLKLPSNPSVDNFSTFTLKVLDFNSGLMLEEYSNLNMNPASPDYILARIGDMYQEWDNTNRRYKMYGDFPNVSDYIRIEVNSAISEEGPDNKQALPFGFYGPPKPRGFMLASGSQAARFEAGSPDDPHVWVEGIGSTPTTPGDGSDNFITGTMTAYSAAFEWPTIPLRTNGSDGYSNNPYKVYWGIRPTIDANSTLKDPDYVDYIRRWNAPNYSYTTGLATEYSFVFSLDDIIVDSSAGTVTYTSGSRKAGTSQTALKGVTNSSTNDGLIDLNVKQFVMPLFGGFEGLDITEKEPFRNAIVADGTESTNYLLYTVNKAIDSVADPEVAPANLMLIPGIHQAAITNRLINTCERRKDCLAIIDLQGDYVPAVESTDTAATRRGSVQTAVSTLRGRNLNTSYACCFYPWVQITDNLNASERVWIPSSVAGLGAMAQSEAKSEVWFAPAGFNRGGLGNLGGARGPRVVQARQRLDSSERDDLYEININPIATFPNEGVVIFGQKTLQVTPSALDRINVRRLLLFLKSKVNVISRNLLFDQNVSSTWARFTSQVEPLLSDVQARFGITEYKLVLDETTTTPDLIDRNIMYAKIFLKPARAIEYIVVDFIITRSGADFA